MIAVGLLILALSGQPDPGATAAQTAGAPSTGQPAAAHAATTPSQDDDKVICKTVPVTGSRFGAVDCMSKKDWAAQAAAAREFVNKATSGVCTGSVCH